MNGLQDKMLIYVLKTYQLMKGIFHCMMFMMLMNVLLQERLTYPVISITVELLKINQIMKSQRVCQFLQKLISDYSESSTRKSC